MSLILRRPSQACTRVSAPPLATTPAPPLVDTPFDFAGTFTAAVIPLHKNPVPVPQGQAASAGFSMTDSHYRVPGKN
jgi:hypothetical protein